MKKDEVKVSSGLGFDDLCKFIEKCVSKKYQVDKTESFRVSTQSLYRFFHNNSPKIYCSWALVTF